MPHENPHNATRVTYAIGNVEVPVVARYAEGHTLTAHEAAALNQLIQENTRNNLYQKWKKQDEKGEGKSVAERQDEAIEYQTTYEFGVRRAGRPTSVTHDPVKAEALNIIIRAIKNKLQAKGKAVKGKAELIKAQAEKILEEGGAFAQAAMQSAKEYVEQMQAMAGASDDLGLGSLETSGTDETPAAE